MQLFSAMLKLNCLFAYENMKNHAQKLLIIHNCFSFTAQAALMVKKWVSILENGPRHPLFFLLCAAAYLRWFCMKSGENNHEKARLLPLSTQLHSLKARVRPRFFDQVGHETMFDLVEISIFSLNLVFIRLTQIINRTDKNWAQF